MADGSQRRAYDVQVGDAVIGVTRDGRMVRDEVMWILHEDAKVVASYVKIEAETDVDRVPVAIELSPLHLMPVYSGGMVVGSQGRDV